MFHVLKQDANIFRIFKGGDILFFTFAEHFNSPPAIIVDNSLAFIFQIHPI